MSRRSAGSFSGVLVSVLAAVALSGCGAPSADKAGGHTPTKPRVLVLADAGTDPAELTNFASAVAKLSHGTLRIDIKSNWRLGETNYEVGLIRDVRTGKADLGWAGSRAWDGVGELNFRALGAPFLIDSYPLEERVLESSVTTPMLQRLGPLGLTGLGILPGQIRRPLGTTSPLVKPADFAGLTIGVQQSRVADATMRALGARPIWLPINRVDIRRFDGIEQRLSTINGWRYDLSARYLTANVDLWPRPVVLFANSALFDALTAGQQRALRLAAHSTIPAQLAWDRASDQEAGNDICRAGIVTFETATSADLAALRAAVQPVYDGLERDPATRRAIQAIEAIKTALNDAPDPGPRCERSGRAPTTAKTALDGVWEMNTKIGDEPTDPTPIAENYGHWVYVFDRGRFAITQEYENACTWGYGRYTVHGHQTAWTFTDGGGIAPNGAENKPGEFFRFNWSRYRDSVRLSSVKGAISPLNFDGRPWRLLSATPSRRYLSARCPPPASALSG